VVGEEGEEALVGVVGETKYAAIGGLDQM